MQLNDIYCFFFFFSNYFCLVVAAFAERRGKRIFAVVAFKKCNSRFLLQNVIDDVRQFGRENCVENIRISGGVSMSF